MNSSKKLESISDLIELHLVGGFLGSGKTTAIIQAARLLIADGLRVGIITNEQGKHLVDTAFLRKQGLPTLEVAGGCFCCHLDDFKGRLEEITKRFNPQVVFAESVGSCTDLVATVVKPFIYYQNQSFQLTSLSVFTDSRLLLRYLRRQELPFSDSIIYIFEKQIEEAGLLVINKTDLLSITEVDEVVQTACLHFPGKIILPQNSLDESQVIKWLSHIRSPGFALPKSSLILDYDAYAAGEGRFAWLDRELEIDVSASALGDTAAALIRDIKNGLLHTEACLAHLKFLVSSGDESVKVNLTALDDTANLADLAKVRSLSGSQLQLTVNAMFEGDLKMLSSRLDNIIEKFAHENGVDIKVKARFDRAPGYPHPTMRITN